MTCQALGKSIGSAHDSFEDWVIDNKNKLNPILKTTILVCALAIIAAMTTHHLGFINNQQLIRSLSASITIMTIASYPLFIIKSLGKTKITFQNKCDQAHAKWVNRTAEEEEKFQKEKKEDLELQKALGKTYENKQQ